MYQPLARVYRELSSALCAHRDIWAIAICGAALFSAAGVFETLYKTNRVDLVVAAIGILNSCFIEIRLIEYRAVQRSLFIVVLNIFLCISFALGSVSGLVVWPGLVGIFICAYLSARFADAGKLAGLFAMLLMLTFVNGLSLGAVPQQSVHYALLLLAGSLVVPLITVLYFTLFPASGQTAIFLKDIVYAPAMNGKKWRYFGWLAISAAAAYSIAFNAHLPSAGMAAMTAFVALRYDIHAARVLVRNRMYGTVIGLIVATPFVIVSDMLWLQLPVLFISMLLAAVLSASRAYGIFVFFLTLMITISNACINEAGAAYMGIRFADTALALAIATVVLYWLGPWTKRLFENK